LDIDAMRKDLRTMLDEGRAHGIPLPVAGETLTALNEASAADLRDPDCADIPAYWAKKADH
jgi:3-hydroxyisobutyrate dehydrogenase-like beta-hydroxyacid dehydrogenase